MGNAASVFICPLFVNVMETKAEMPEALCCWWLSCVLQQNKRRHFHKHGVRHTRDSAAWSRRKSGERREEKQTLSGFVVVYLASRVALHVLWRCMLQIDCMIPPPHPHLTTLCIHTRPSCTSSVYGNTSEWVWKGLFTLELEMVQFSSDVMLIQIDVNKHLFWSPADKTGSFISKPFIK